MMNEDKKLPFCTLRATLLVCTVTALFALAVTGCSEDDEQPLRGTNAGNGENHVGEDAGDLDIGDASTDAESDVEPDAEPIDDVDDNDTESNGDNDENGDNGEELPSGFVDGPCGTMYQMGEIGEGIHDVTVDFGDFDVEESTGCLDDAADDAAVLAFEVMNFAWLEFSADAPVAMQLRFNHCGFSSEYVACDEAGLGLPTTFVSDDVYLVVEPLDEFQGDSVEVTLDLHQPADCDDEGATECVDDQTARVCRTAWIAPDDPMWREGPCPGECDGGCVGDSCDAPLVVESGDVIEFDNMGFFHHYDPHNHPEPSCQMETGGDQTPGRELVMKLEDLNAGDEIALKIEQDLGIYEGHDVGWPFVAIRKTCQPDASCLALWTDLDDELTFEVEDGGDHFVFVDSTWHKMDGTFEIAVDVN